MKEEQKRGVREDALQELKRSWERHVHLKKLRELAKAGPAAVRDYAVRALSAYGRCFAPTASNYRVRVGVVGSVPCIPYASQTEF